MSFQVLKEIKFSSFYVIFHVILLIFYSSRIEELLGYESKELVGRSFYDFYHALDNPAIEKCHRDCKLYDKKGGDGGGRGRGGGA